MHGEEVLTPAAISAGTAAPVPYTWLTPQRPNHEPSGSWLSISQRTPRRLAGRSRSPSAANISTACAVTSALGSSITSPKSRNGSSRTIVSVLSASNAPQPPLRLCIPSSHSTARSTAPSMRAASSPAAALPFCAALAAWWAWAARATRCSASTTSAVSSTSG